MEIIGRFETAPKSATFFDMFKLFLTRNEKGLSVLTVFSLAMFSV
jgi:hypothetical protein